MWDFKTNQLQETSQALIEWYSSRDFRLINPTEIPTHNRDGTLDLAFSSDQRARCQIRFDLHTTSDHETLVSTIFRESKTQTPSKLRYDALDDDLFLQLLGSNQDYDSINTHFELEEEAKDILQKIMLLCQDLARAPRRVKLAPYGGMKSVIKHTKHTV